MTNIDAYLSLDLDTGDRIAVVRDEHTVRGLYIAPGRSPRAIHDLRLDDRDETVTRLRARSLGMWLVVRAEGVIGGMFCGSPATGRANYA